MPYLQIVNGKYRVRIVVPPELRPYLPPPHTGKANLTRALGTGNEREANRLAVPWIADFQAAMPSRPGEFHPEPLTDPDLTLSRHPARATKTKAAALRSPWRQLLTTVLGNLA